MEKEFKISAERWPKNDLSFSFVKYANDVKKFKTVSVGVPIEVNKSKTEGTKMKTNVIKITLDGGETVGFFAGILPAMDKFPSQGTISFDSKGNIAKVVAS